MRLDLSKCYRVESEGNEIRAIILTQNRQIALEALQNYANLHGETKAALTFKGKAYSIFEMGDIP